MQVLERRSSHAPCMEAMGSNSQEASLLWKEKGNMSYCENFYFLFFGKRMSYAEVVLKGCSRMMEAISVSRETVKGIMIRLVNSLVGLI